MTREKLPQEWLMARDSNTWTMLRKKEKKVVDKAIKDYEEYLKEYFESSEYDDEGEEFLDGELPF